MFIISSIVTGKNLKRIGRANGLKFGMLFIVSQLIIMGSLEYVDNVPIFVAMSFLA